ncbi:hypothetical protein EVAR_50774_1 [Eumeta japonica]|uniref:Uncharacterized protein n=1 Tax=Eumeta variegata TaxID=151549 RepID=A0A4C1WSX0_EUMVA|nr:hypothetical protein EVAR_50774_1 [Eumeta japonica]
MDIFVSNAGSTIKPGTRVGVCYKHGLRSALMFIKSRTSGRRQRVANLFCFGFLQIGNINGFASLVRASCCQLGPSYDQGRLPENVYPVLFSQAFDVRSRNNTARIAAMRRVLRLYSEFVLTSLFWRENEIASREPMCFRRATPARTERRPRPLPGSDPSTDGASVGGAFAANCPEPVNEV